MTILWPKLLIIMGVLPLTRLAAQESSLINVALGLSFQSDASLTRGVRLSPVGLTGGAGFYRTHRGVEVGITGEVSWYMQIAADRVTVGPVAPGTPSGSDPDGSFALGKITAEIGEDPTKTVSWFACVGAVTVISSPRAGNSASPLGCVGVRVTPFLHGRLSISYEQFLTPLGETRFQIPVVVAIPLKH
jgi:hypothetical protein